MFLYLKIVYRNLKNDEWWICWGINPTFWNLLKVSWWTYKENKEEINYWKNVEKEKRRKK